MRELPSRRRLRSGVRCRITCTLISSYSSVSTLCLPCSLRFLTWLVSINNNNNKDILLHTVTRWESHYSSPVQCHYVFPFLLMSHASVDSSAGLASQLHTCDRGGITWLPTVLSSLVVTWCYPVHSSFPLAHLSVSQSELQKGWKLLICNTAELVGRWNRHTCRIMCDCNVCTQDVIECNILQQFLYSYVIL